MENQLVKSANGVAKQEQPTLQSMLSKTEVKKRFEEMLGKKAAGFISSIISATKSTPALADCEPNTVISAAVIAATLDLPIQNNLGFAAIVPYNESYKDGVVWKKRKVAQFQMMYKGYIQLAMRTGQYLTINVCEVYEGELVKENRFTGEFVFDATKKKSDTIVGYTAYFKMVNQFEKTVYWTVEKITEHAKKYSKTFDNDKGRWKLDFQGMAMKTVLKMLLSKYGILSVDIQLQQAIIADQSVTKDGDTLDISYVDNSETAIVFEDLQELFELKKEILSDEELTNAKRIIDEKEENSYARLHTLLMSK